MTQDNEDTLKLISGPELMQRQPRPEWPNNYEARERNRPNSFKNKWKFNKRNLTVTYHLPQSTHKFDYEIDLENDGDHPANWLHHLSGREDFYPNDIEDLAKTLKQVQVTHSWLPIFGGIPQKHIPKCFVELWETV